MYLKGLDVYTIFLNITTPGILRGLEIQHVKSNNPCVCWWIDGWKDTTVGEYKLWKCIYHPQMKKNRDGKK